MLDKIGYRKMLSKIGAFILVSMSMLGSCIYAQTLQNVEAVTMQDGSYQVRYHFDRDVDNPVHYYNEKKNLLVVDFKATGIKDMSREKRIDNSILDTVRNIYNQSRVRSTISVKSGIDYSVSNYGNMVAVNIENRSHQNRAPNWDDLVVQNQQKAVSTTATLKDIGFVRNSRGEGVVEVFLPSSDTEVSVVEEGKKIRLALKGHIWDPSQNRRIQVTDFATPVAAIEVVNVQGQAFVDIITQSPFEYRVQQVGNSKYQLIVSPKRAATVGVASEADRKVGSRKEYTGELITINFQDIDVRAVLQIIADFTGLNIVVSDKVNSRITIRLQNVPWDQALDTVLMYTGLGQAREGNIIFIAPQEDLSMFEGVNLVTEIIQINYADAAAIAQVIATRVGGSTDGTTGAGLSKHGSVSVDVRTNTLIVQDTVSQLRVIHGLLETLDRPVRQVQISAQIVAASDTFSRDLGVKWGVNYDNNRRPKGGGPSSSENSTGSDWSGATGTGHTGDLAIDLGAGSASTLFEYMVLGRNVNIGLEISAMESEGRGEQLSNPVILTTDRKTAYIKQGSEFAYSTTSDGGTNTEFKEIVMELNVTPQITPDNKIIMDILIKKDEPMLENMTDGEPGLRTKELSTQALVSDGETIVLGGIYEHNISQITEKVPFFGDLPFIGNLFKRNMNQNEKVELLIFVTPNIIDTLGY